MSNYFIDPNSFRYYDAPLKTVNENGLIQFNRLMVENKAQSFNRIVPHYYNKMAYYQCVNDIYQSRFLIQSGNPWINRSMTVLNSAGRLVYAPTDKPADLDDFAIFYELDKLSNYKWDNVGNNAPLVEVVMALTNNYYTERQGITTQKTRALNERRLTKATWTTEAYNDWYYVKSWRVYNRKTGESANRQLVGRGTEGDTVYPCIPWDLEGIYYYSWDSPTSKSKANVYNGTVQGFTLLNMRSAFSLQELGEWYLLQCHEDTITDEFVARIIGKHDSTLGDNIKFVAGVTANPTFEPMFKIVVGTNDYEYLYKVTDVSLQPRIVFKTEDDFLALLADWGVKHATNDETDAQTLPAELFPDYDPGGGFVPGGGDSTGYDDDPTIPSIPSYSDNTSDSIDLSNPNITSLNAASAYALNLLQVKDVLNWLMTDSFVSNISNLFSDKLSALNDLKIMPFDIVNHDTSHTEASTQLTLANVSTDINCHKILPSYNCIVNGGKINYTAYWGNYNDYTAASYQLYVPYGGIIDMSPSHIVNCEVEIKYAVDMMTGNATAVIYSNGVLVKTLPCQLGQSVPITFSNTNQRDIKTALSALNIANNIGGVVANAAVGNVGGAVSAGLSTLGGAASAAMTNPLAYSSKGGFASGTSLLMPQNAFLIVTRAQLAIPSNRQSVMGIPSNISSTISNFVGSGFVQIRASHINTTATTAEQQQIISLLSSGIFL